MFTQAISPKLSIFNVIYGACLGVHCTREAKKGNYNIPSVIYIYLPLKIDRSVSDRSSDVF